jgi:tetratricopeptide (TPR) repeat protein
MEWSRESDLQAGLRLASRLKWFWHLSGTFAEGASWLEDLLAAAKSAPVELDPLLRAEALSVASWMAYWSNGGMPASIASLQESIALVEKEQGPTAARIRADNLYIAGIHAIASQDPSRADQLGRQCLQAYEASGSEFGMAEACIVLYGSAFNVGDLETAQHWNKTAIALRRKIGDADGLAFDLTLGTLVPFCLGDYEGAKRMLAEALQACQKTRYKYNLGLALCYRGMISLVEGEPGQALDYFSQQAAVAIETSDSVSKTFTVYYLALLLLKIRQYRLAVRLIGALEGSSGHHAVLLYVNPVFHEAFEESRLEARQALGEAEYEAAYAEGRLLSLDQAVALGLQQAEAALRS